MKKNILIEFMHWVFTKPFIVFSVCFCFFISFYAIKEFYTWYNYDRHFSNVLIRSEINFSECDVDYPLYIQLENKSSQTIWKTYFAVSIHKIGRSTNLAHSHMEKMSSDLIIQPNESISLCSKLTLADGSDLYTPNVFDVFDNNTSISELDAQEVYMAKWREFNSKINISGYIKSIVFAT